MLREKQIYLPGEALSPIDYSLKDFKSNAHKELEDKEKQENLEKSAPEFIQRDQLSKLKENELYKTYSKRHKQLNPFIEEKKTQEIPSEQPASVSNENFAELVQSIKESERQKILREYLIEEKQKQSEQQKELEFERQKLKQEELQKKRKQELQIIEQKRQEYQQNPNIQIQTQQDSDEYIRINKNTLIVGSIAAFFVLIIFILLNQIHSTTNMLRSLERQNKYLQQQTRELNEFNSSVHLQPTNNNLNFDDKSEENNPPTT